MKLGQYTFKRVPKDEAGEKEEVTIVGPDIGDYHEYHPSITLPVEALVKYVQKMAKKARKKRAKR